MNLNKLFIIIGALIAISFLITGCLPNQANSSAVSGSSGKYYTGKVGVDAEIINLPTRVYYTRGDLNTFDFGVRVHNQGTSLTRGATFISGYDPQFMNIEGQIIDPNADWKDCTIDLSSVGNNFNDWAGLLSCTFANGASFTYNQQRGGLASANINNLGLFLNMLGVETNSDFLDTLSFNLIGQNGEGITNLGLDFDIAGWDIEMIYHGVALLSAMKSFNLTSYNGRDYMLEANNGDYPGGGQDFLDYSAEITNWPQGLDEFPLDLMLTNCYGYTTYASPMVCIDPMPETEQKKVCKPKTQTFSSQGSPVAVTKIEQENGRKKIVFTIHVKNVGDGEIIDWAHIERCSPYYPGALTAKHKDVLYNANLVRVENQKLDCSPANIVRLDENGEGIITCIYNIQYQNLQSAYQTPLVVEFWYGYQETAIQRVLFKRI